jgi:CheY-like chemotaxis protein
MALRVLLADESVTIKKVIQLALQDFAVEVKAVPVGLDVLEVSKSFQPDLVFADILLQKRSGYDVCRDLKKDAQTAAIPVILMWSSFMELDAKQVDACGADGRLEKPFEVEMLRKLVLDLVPRTRSQRLATFLEYPATIAAPLKAEVDAEKAQRQAAASEDAKDPKPQPQTAAPPPKPRMPPPLVTTPTASAGIGDGPPTTGFVPSIPDRPALATSAESSLPTLQTKITGPGFTLDIATGSYPRSSAGSFKLPETSAPLGALPDLQLDGQPNVGSTSSGGGDSRWSMDSFEPLDLSPLTLGDDEDGEAESFKPIRLPDSEPVLSHSGPISAFTLMEVDSSSSDLDLLDSGPDDEADKWSNSSLDKYRLPPLKPDEALATDEMTPEFSIRKTLQDQNVDRPTYESAVFELDLDQEEVTPSPEPAQTQNVIAPSTLEQTEIIPRQRSVTGYQTADEPDPNGDDVAEFTLSEADHQNLSNLEIEPVDQSEVTRPSIVRELLRDPDFSYDDESVPKQDRTHVSPDGTIDLGSAGRPAERKPADRKPPIAASLESRVRAEVGAHLEPQLEKLVEKIVAELLPKIAEKIIKRELERLLEDS